MPGDYVEVIVDATKDATRNTYFKRTFWVKKGAEVNIPVQKPNGKTKIDNNGVKTSYSFDKWVDEGNSKSYDGEIKDSFTKDVTTIKATFKAGENIKPEPKNDIYVGKDSKPTPKDFIKNHYDDNDPNNEKNLPPGSKYEFETGKEPNTKQVGDGTTTIIVTYPNGERRKYQFLIRS